MGARKWVCYARLHLVPCMHANPYSPTDILSDTGHFSPVHLLGFMKTPLNRAVSPSGCFSFLC